MMAAGDYRSCDVCGGKAFYDANLDYDTGDKIDGTWVYSKTPYRIGGEDQGEYAPGLGYVGDWAVICTDCAKTHRTAILPILPDNAVLYGFAMNALSLFSGIGGLDLAAEWAGFKTVAFCERDKFCQKVLRKHWPEVRIFDDVRTIDTSELPAVDIVFGGYPCQPFSSAGQRKGANDERHMWPHMLDIVRRVKPAWVVGENVKGHISLGLDDVLDDMENEGFETRAFAIPAGAVKAPHSRERVFVVSYSESNRHGAGGTVGNLCKKDGGQGFGLLPEFTVPTWWDSEPGVCRVANGLPAEVDRLRSLGNAVVPFQAYPIFAAIAETYNAESNGGASHPTRTPGYRAGTELGEK